VEQSANPPAGKTIRPIETEGAAGALMFLTNAWPVHDRSAAFSAFMTRLAQTANAA
jgi:hypothetical protein